MENLLLLYQFPGLAGGFSAECCILPGIILILLVFWLVYQAIQETNKKEEEQQRLEREAKQEEIRERMRLVEERERSARWNEKYDKFLTSPEYVYVEQFVLKYQSRDGETDRLNLQQLLKAKAWEFDHEEMTMLLAIEQKTQRSDEVKHKILLAKPESETEAIKAYLNFYRSDDETALTALSEILKENFEWSNYFPELKEKVKKIEEQIKLENFEKRLLTEHKLIAIDDIDQYTGYEFEAFLKDLFGKMGYQVEQTRLSGDQGADLVVVKFGEKTVIQAKRFTAKVGNSAVQEIMAAISLYEARSGMVVTNNYFTPAAAELAQANNIKLIDRDALEDLIKKYW